MDNKTRDFAAFVAALPDNGEVTFEQLEQAKALADALDIIANPMRITLQHAEVRIETDDPDNTAMVPLIHAVDVYKNGTEEHGFKVTRIQIDPDLIEGARQARADWQKEEQQSSLAA